MRKDELVRARRGMAFLDDHLGSREWVNEIDLPDLAMDSPYRCVIGQLFGDYFAGMRLLGFPDAKALGFNRRERPWTIDASHRQWERLEVAWCQVIIERIAEMNESALDEALDQVLEEEMRELVSV